MKKRTFKTEVSELLSLIIHSLYSNKEIFLRELISNSSDAIEKLKTLTLTNKDYKNISLDPKVDIFIDEKAKTVTIQDNGIGMNEEDLINNLGTIARSGTKEFVKQLTKEKNKSSDLIGQFGVGFYSAFMVADKVDVYSKKANEDKVYLWSSDGKSGFSIDEKDSSVLDSQGTKIVVYLNEEGASYLYKWNIESIIKKYSNHVQFPIFLHYEETKTVEEGEGDKKTTKEVVEQKTEQINSASALWKRSKSELKKEDYNNFYKSLTGDMEDPAFYIHTQAEGTIEYTTLFYIPKKAPLDMFRYDYKAGTKLYVKRVFITDDEKELMPTYLRFVRGIIDAEDLPLNVSREILQENAVLRKIKSSSVKKILSEFAKLQEKDRKAYDDFYQEFAIPVKEGLYQDYENREKLLELVMYKSSERDKYITLKEYTEKMKKDQKTIYYITGKKEASLKDSPLLEQYKNKGYEVLLMSDEIDEVVLSSVFKYKDYDFKSINVSSTEDDIKTDADKEKEKALDPFVKKAKEWLKDTVKDVKANSMLGKYPSSIVTDKNDPTIQMQKLLKSMGQGVDTKFVLELNPEHKIVKNIVKLKDEKQQIQFVHMLLEEAMLVSGVEIKNTTNFVNRINDIIENYIN